MENIILDYKIERVVSDHKEKVFTEYYLVSDKNAKFSFVLYSGFVQHKIPRSHTIFNISLRYDSFETTSGGNLQKMPAYFFFSSPMRPGAVYFSNGGRQFVHSTWEKVGSRVRNSSKDFFEFIDYSRIRPVLDEDLKKLVKSFGYS